MKAHVRISRYKQTTQLFNLVSDKWGNRGQAKNEYLDTTESKFSVGVGSMVWNHVHYAQIYGLCMSN